jgi:type IV pilus assembly protein PilC
LDRSVVRIGEETGRLVDALEFLTDYYQKREEQKRMVTSALSYPIITLSIAVIVLVFMLLVVVPMFEQVYARMGGELPAITRQIIGMSESAPAVLGIMVLLGPSMYGVRHMFGSSDKYQSITSRIVMRLPLVSGLIRKYQVSRFCRIMHLLVSSDVPILQALYLMRGIIIFYPYRQSIEEVCRKIEKGQTLTGGMDKYENLYGKRFLVLLKVGEETNSIEQMLLTQANDTNAELEHEIKQLNNIVEPFLILAIGIIVAFVLIAMYMPMFKMGNIVY